MTGVRLQITLRVVAAVLPALLLLWYFRARDKNPEPRHVVWITFWLGVLIVFPILAIVVPVGKLLEMVPNPYLAGLGTAFLGAAIPEEFFKFLVVVFYSARHREFNEPMDGMVYGAAASLGFATFENVLYVLQLGLPIALLRAITAVPMHAMLGAIMGYYVSKWKFGPLNRSGALLMGLVVPILLHGLFDFGPLTLLAFEQRGLEITPEATLPLIVMMLLPFTLLLSQFVWVIRTNRRLRAEQGKGAYVSGDPLP